MNLLTHPKGVNHPFRTAAPSRMTGTAQRRKNDHDRHHHNNDRKSFGTIPVHNDISKKPIYIIGEKVIDPSNIYSSSIATYSLATNDGSYNSLRITFYKRFSACAEESDHLPKIGIQTGYLASVTPIELSSLDSMSLCATDLNIDPFGLTAPYEDTNIYNGSFSIQRKTSLSKDVYYNIGLSLFNERYFFSNFITSPLTETTEKIYCQPNLDFFVQIGTVPKGSVLDYDSAIKGAAECNFSSGISTATATLSPDLTWSVS